MQGRERRARRHTISAGPLLPCAGSLGTLLRRVSMLSGCGCARARTRRGRGNVRQGAGDCGRRGAHGALRNKHFTELYRAPARAMSGIAGR